MEFKPKDVTKPKDGYEVIARTYWICENGDPTKALFYGQSLQGNRNHRICEHMIERGLYKNHPVPIEIVYLETAFIPCRSYA